MPITNRYTTITETFSHLTDRRSNPLPVLKLQASYFPQTKQTTRKSGITVGGERVLCSKSLQGRKPQGTQLLRT